MNSWDSLLTLPFGAFIGLLTSSNERNDLGSVLIPPGVGEKEQEQWKSWLESQPDDVVVKAKLLVPALTNPAWIARITFVDESDRIVTLFAVKKTDNPDDTLILCTSQPRDTIRIDTVPSIHHLASDLADFITPGPPLARETLSLQMPLASFLTLAGISDLFRRRRYASLLDDTTITDSFTPQEVQAVIALTNDRPDLRWFLSHLLSVTSIEPNRALSLGLEREFSWLLEHSFIKENNGEYTCSENCQSLIESFNSGTSRLGIAVLKLAMENEILMDSSYFIRAPFLIWGICIGDTSEIPTVITTLNFQEILTFMDALFTKVETLEKREHPRTAPQEPNIFCKSCGAPLPSTAKFCRKCGKPVHPDEGGE